MVIVNQWVRIQRFFKSLRNSILSVALYPQLYLRFQYVSILPFSIPRYVWPTSESYSELRRSIRDICCGAIGAVAFASGVFTNQFFHTYRMFRSVGCAVNAYRDEY